MKSKLLKKKVNDEGKCFSEKLFAAIVQYRSDDTLLE